MSDRKLLSEDLIEEMQLVLDPRLAVRYPELWGDEEIRREHRTLGLEEKFWLALEVFIPMQGVIMYDQWNDAQLVKQPLSERYAARQHALDAIGDFTMRCPQDDEWLDDECVCLYHDECENHKLTFFCYRCGGCSAPTTSSDIAKLVQSIECGLPMTIGNQYLDTVMATLEWIKEHESVNNPSVRPSRLLRNVVVVTDDSDIISEVIDYDADVTALNLKQFLSEYGISMASVEQSAASTAGAAELDDTLSRLNDFCAKVAAPYPYGRRSNTAGDGNAAKT